MSHIYNINVICNHTAFEVHHYPDLDLYAGVLHPAGSTGEALQLHTASHTILHRNYAVSNLNY